MKRNQEDYFKKKRRINYLKKMEKQDGKNGNYTENNLMGKYKRSLKKISKILLARNKKYSFGATLSLRRTKSKTY